MALRDPKTRLKSSPEGTNWPSHIALWSLRLLIGCWSNIEPCTQAFRRASASYPEESWKGSAPQPLRRAPVIRSDRRVSLAQAMKPHRSHASGTSIHAKSRPYVEVLRGGRCRRKARRRQYWGGLGQAGRIGFRPRCFLRSVGAVNRLPLRARIRSLSETVTSPNRKGRLVWQLATWL